MDRRAQNNMLGIGMGIPKEIMRKMVKTEKPFEDVRRSLESMKNNPHLDLRTRRNAENILRDPRAQEAFNKTTTTIDPSASKEAQEYINTKVDQYIKKHGKMDTSEHDDFLARMHKKKMV